MQQIGLHSLPYCHSESIHVHGSCAVPTRREGASSRCLYPSAAKTVARHGTVLPATGYNQNQIADLQQTIDQAECDAVVIGTPINLARLLQFKVPATRIRYELQEIGSPTLEDLLQDF